MRSLWQDIRFAFRVFSKAPLFVIVAVLTLAVGIGATTAIFSVADAVLLRPLSYRDPERLVLIWERNFVRDWPRNVIAAANFLDWRVQSNSFEQMAAIVNGRFSVTGAGEPEEVPVQYVSPSLFAMLGALSDLAADRLCGSGAGAGHDRRLRRDVVFGGATDALVGCSHGDRRAQGGDVLWLVLRQGMFIAGAGLAVGLGGAFAVTRTMSSLLYNVKPTDPLTFALVALLLTATAALAMYVPARRATKVDPMVVLRYE